MDGYLTGMASYELVGGLALGEVLAGESPRPEFPDALRQVAPARRRGAFSLAIAEAAAERHDVVACAGLLAMAAIEPAQAALAERGEWALNEKGIVRRAGLGARVRRSWPRLVTARSSSRERSPPCGRPSGSRGAAGRRPPERPTEARRALTPVHRARTRGMRAAGLGRRPRPDRA